jgi:hypothetical protein
MDPIRPNLFREDSSRNLPKIFPPDTQQGPEFSLPKILLPTVQLVHDYLSTLPYVACSLYDVVGGNDITSIEMNVGIPDAYVFIVDHIGLFTDDAALREYTLWVRYQMGALGVFDVPIANVTNNTVASRWTVPNQGARFIVPPAGKIKLTVPALTAGAHLRFTAVGLQIPAGQFPPRS